MKKVLILVLIMSGLTSLSQAQFKPEKGNFTTELQLSLFNYNIKVDYYGETIDYSTGPFSMPGFRFRYFFSEKLALRTTIGLNFDHDKISRDFFNENEYGQSKIIKSGNNTYKNRYTTFSIAPGLEYHFGDWERMSLYVGGELFFGVTTSKSTVDVSSDEFHYSRTYYEDEFFLFKTIYTERTIETKNCSYYNSEYNYGYRQNAPMNLGINALFGMDFYIYKGLYMGAELGFGYSYETYLKGSYTENSTIVTTPASGIPNIVTDSKDEKLEDKISSGNLSFRYNPMIRVGWRF